MYFAKQELEKGTAIMELENFKVGSSVCTVTLLFYE